MPYVIPVLMVWNLVVVLGKTMGTFGLLLVTLATNINSA